MSASASSPYPSELSVREWTILALLLPPSKPGGRPRSVNLRGILNGIFHVLRSVANGGCSREPTAPGPRSIPTFAAGASWDLGADPFDAPRTGAAAERARAHAERCDHRQPVSQDRRTWRPAWL